MAKKSRKTLAKRASASAAKSPSKSGSKKTASAEHAQSKDHKSDASATPAPRAEPKPTPRTSSRFARVTPRRIKIKHPKFRRGPKPADLQRVPGAWSLFMLTLTTMKRYWKLFTVLIVVITLLNWIFVRSGGQSLNLTSLRHTFNQSFGSQASSAGKNLALFGMLIGSNASPKQGNASPYQTFVVVVSSLATIWLLRHIYAGTRVRVKEGFYLGMQPLIPYMLILLLIGIQLVPVLAGGFLLLTANSRSLLVSGADKIGAAAVGLALALLSLYLISSSLMATYIVTLPNMTPMRALRKAREIVRFRRFAMIRKILFLPLSLLVVSILIFLPLIYIALPIVEVVFMFYSTAALVFTHGYLYALYRSLIE